MNVKNLRLSIMVLATLVLVLSLGVLSVEGSQTSPNSVDTLPPSQSSPATYTLTPTIVSPAGTQAIDPAGVQDLVKNTGAQVSIAPQTGAARFVRWSANNAQSFATTAGAAPEARANAFFQQYGSVFGITDASSELQLADSRTDNLGTTRLAYNQVYNGVPVFAGRLHVHFNANGAMSAVNGIFIPKLSLNTSPTLNADRAGQIAEAHVAAKLALDVENPNQNITGYSAQNSNLYVFRAGLARGIVGANHLVYEVEVTNNTNLREFVYVDAHTGVVVDQISGIHEDLSRRVYEGGYGPSFEVWEEEDGPYLGDDPDIKNIIEFTEDSYNLFSNITGGQWLSYNGNDARMEIVNNDPRISCPNANWNGISTNYCTDVTGDDTVAHEWAHAYTEYTHNLIYQWQPGALNESYSDIFGEIVDLINGAGTDSPGGLRTANACSVYQASLPPVVEVNSPGSIAGIYAAGGAAFGPPLTTGGVTGDLVLADDGTGGGTPPNPSNTDACEPLTNGAQINGNIAVVDRGTCNFTVKVKNAQDAGAIGVIVANHVTGGDGVTNMSGSDPTITIPSVFIGYSDGQAIQAELSGGVNATLKLDAGGVAPDNSYRWLSGEDDPAFNGAIRDMWTPTCFSDAGKVTDTEYHCTADDGGGVHSNSGVPNHAFALMVDGGNYNGQVVGSLGLTKTTHIYWRAMATYQHQATDFADHADSLEQSCQDLVGVNLLGLTTGAPSGVVINAADCTEVSNAIAAVEFRTEPTQCNFQPLLQPNPPALCATDGPVVTVFSDTLETQPTGWTLSNEGVFPEYDSSDWAWVSNLPAGRDGSAFFGVDPIDVGDCSPGSDDQSGVKYLDSPVITIPEDATVARLAFDHYVATEALWDGGNMWISVNGGDWQAITPGDFTFNPYNAPLQSTSAGNTNPLAGQSAFTGSDAGEVVGSWGQSQVNLSAYASRGDTVQLRFALGVDGCNGLDGWYVDDVNVHYCAAESVPPEASVSLPGGATTLSSTQGPNSTDTQTLTINNDGIDDLTWSVDEDEARAANYMPEDWSPDLRRQANLDLKPSPGRISSPQYNNVVQDSSFEAGSPNPFWTETAATFLPPLCDPGSCGAALAIDGDWYAWYGGWGALHISALEQAVTIGNTGAAELTFWALTGGVAGSDVVTVTLDSTPVYVIDATNAPQFASYQQVTVDVSAYADGGSHDLRIEGATVGSVIIDDVRLNDDIPCVAPGSVPWLSVSPTSGTTGGLQSSDVNVTFDSTGLANGTYSGYLCITTNDSNNALISVPVDLTVDAIPDWEQTVIINSTVYTDQTTFDGIQPTDVITVVDNISINSSENVTFTLRYGWTESFVEAGYEVYPPGSDGGSQGTFVTPSDKINEWTVFNTVPNQPFAITRTFTIAPGEWAVDRVSERLIIEGGTAQLPDVVLTFNHPLDIFLPIVIR